MLWGNQNRFFNQDSCIQTDEWRFFEVCERCESRGNMFTLWLSDKSFKAHAQQWENSACVGRIPVMFVCSAVILYLCWFWVTAVCSVFITDYFCPPRSCLSWDVQNEYSSHVHIKHMTHTNYTSQTITRPAPWSLSLYDDTSSQNTKFINLTQTDLPLLYKTKAHTIRLKVIILCTFKDRFVDVNLTQLIMN